MNIGTAAEKSGLPAKTIRYYEEVGLVKAGRSANGYREYAETHVHKLRFLKRARNLGFSVEECRQLLSLYEDKTRESAEVKSIAQTKLHDLEKRLRELTELRNTLRHLVHCCNGDNRPDCPIIDELAG
jgi:MerR family copper efflux transcriptional regulator